MPNNLDFDHIARTLCASRDGKIDSSGGYFGAMQTAANRHGDTMPKVQDCQVVHIAVYFYDGRYYPKLCISRFDANCINRSHMIAHSWSKMKDGEKIRNTIRRIKERILRRICIRYKKAEEIAKIREAIEELEKSFPL